MKRRILTLLLMTVISLGMLPMNVDAATKYPVIKNYYDKYGNVDGIDTWISKNHCVRFLISYEYENLSADILYYDGIGAHLDQRGKLNLGPHGRIECVGRYKGKFYFNVSKESGIISRGLYTIKPGDRKFKCISKNINIKKINKKNLMSGRYLLGWKYKNTDASGGLGHAYVFDIKKGKKVSLGDVHDIKKYGNKLYYLKKSLNKGKIVLKVYRCNLSGKNRKLLKTFKTNLKNDEVYGVGSLSSKNVVYKYWKMVGDEYKSLKYVKRYRK